MDSEEKRVQRRIRRGSLLLSKGSTRRLSVGPADGVHSKEEVENAWTEHATQEGAVFYYNSITKKTTWDIPTGFSLRERKSSIENAEKDWVWVRDEVACFAAATRLGPGSNQFKTLDGRTIIAEDEDIVGKISNIRSINKDTEDMVKMEGINEASVLQNLRLRAEQDEYFTNVGSILVSVNPFKWIDRLYSAEQFCLYRDRHIGEEVPPHFFEISDDAYRGLCEDSRSQSIIISGESGAGKTEATKKCLQYLADVAGSKSGLENKLLATNPILEAFGNAKTVRNSNSSRFGKWTVVKFDQNSKICGGSIVNYLLEKSRVAIQMPGERNYHIFYQLVRGAKPDAREMYHLPKSVSSFQYLCGDPTASDIEGLDDGESFQETLEAFQELDFSETEQHDIFSIVAGVLWLGNIQFQVPVGASNDDPCELNEKESAHALDALADLLSFKKENLLSNIMNRIRNMGGQVIESPLNAQGAIDSCSALAREIYSRLFDWLVTRLNETLSINQSVSETRVIGVLDIFGFEIFKNNSFEQLCINFTNEMLQQHFNNHTFKTETKVYDDEGIEFDPPQFRDNSDVLELLEHRSQGIFVLLDEECVLPRGSDASFVNKIAQLHQGKHPRFISSQKIKKKPKLAFAIEHYAGRVVYNAEGFLEKNKDDLRDNLLSLVSSSSNDFLRDVLFSTKNQNGDDDTEEKQKNGGGGKSKGPKRRHKSQAGFFRKQLDQLMETLSTADPHYIRCIKPNSQKAADRFDPFLCLEQLRYSGVFEAIEIRKQGFPFRRSHKDFYKRYRGLADQSKGEDFPHHGDFSSLSKKLISNLAEIVLELRKVPPSSPTNIQHLADLNACRFGKTMILYRAPEHLTLECMRERRRESAAIKVTAVVLGFIARSRAKYFRKLQRKLASAMEKRNVDSIARALKELEKRVKPPFNIFREKKKAEELMDRIQKETELIKDIDDLAARLKKTTTSAAQFYEEIESLLEHANKYEIGKNYPQYIKTLNSFDKKIASVRELIKAKKELVQCTETSIKDLLVHSIKKAEKLTAEHGTFCEAEILDAKEMLDRVVKEESMMIDLVSALENGRPAGQVGSLQIASIETTTLRARVQQTRAHKGTLTPRANGMLKLAEIIITLRESLAAKDWDAIEGGVTRMDEFEDDIDKFQLPREEIELFKEELNCHTIVSELSSSVAEGYITGTPGELDLSCASIEHLKADLEDAKVLGSTAPVAKAVIQGAERIAHLRDAVLREDWKSAEKVLQSIIAHPLDEYHEYSKKFIESSREEVSLIKRALHNRQIEEKVFECLNGGHISGIVGEISTKNVSTKRILSALKFIEEVVDEDGEYPTKKAKHLTQLIKKLCDIRNAFQKKTLEKLHKTETVKRALELAEKYEVSSAVISELQLVRSELAEQVCIEMLENSVKQGRAGGPVGALEMDKVAVAPLEESLAEAEEIWKSAEMPHGAESRYGSKLLSAVRDLIKLRKFLMAENWDSVEDILATSAALFSSTTEDEANLIQEELNNRTIVAELTRALSLGKPKGSIGELEVEGIEIKALQDDISDAKELGCKTKDAKALLEQASIILELRQNLMDGKWEQIETILDKCRFIHVLEVCKEEIERTRLELHNRTIIHELSRALQSGGANGTLDDLRVDTITFHVLDDALAAAQKLRCESKHAKSLYGVAKILRSTRAAMAQGRFTQLGPLIEDAERQGFLRVEGQDEGFDELVFEFSEPGRIELELARDKFRDELMREELLAALLDGRPSGRVGAIEISSIKLNHLLKLTTRYGLEEPKSKKGKQLATCAKMIVALREEMLSGPDWPEVRKVVDMFRPEKMMETFGFTAVPDIEEELTLIRDELEHRDIITILTEGLELGTIKGVIGDLDLSSLSVTRINQAIEFARSLPRKTPEATRLFNSAIAIRDIRACILSAKDQHTEEGSGPLGDVKWLGSVQLALDKAHGVGVADIAREELQLVQDHVDDIKIIRELCSALAQGAVKGPLGDTNPKSCDKDRLVSALNCAHTLVCKTERAKKLEKTAKVVLQFRTVLLESSWDSLPAQLERSLGISIEGGTPPDPFHGFSEEGSVEFQRLVDECREKLCRTALIDGTEHGGLQGDPGSLFIEQVDHQKLEKACALATRVVQNLSKSTRDLCTLGKALLQIRECFKHGGKEDVDIETAAAVLSSLPSFETLGSIRVAPTPQKELNLALDHVQNYRIISLTRESIEKGHGGNPIQVAHVDSSPLQHALKAISGSLGGPKSDRAKDSVAALNLLLRIRIALQNRDFQDLRLALGDALECSGIGLFPAAEDQIYTARSMLMNYDTVLDVSTALSHGSILELHQSPLDVEWTTLDKALQTARVQVAGELQPIVSKLLSRCEIVSELRRAFRFTAEDNWSAVEGVLAKLKHSASLEELYDDLDNLGEESSDAVRGLIRQIEEEEGLAGELHEDRMAQHLLIEAMADGHLGGTVGNISTSVMKVTPLEHATETAAVVRRPSRKMLGTLHHARYLLSLRRAVMSDDWNSVYQIARRWREETRSESSQRLSKLPLADDDSYDSDMEEGDGNLVCYALELQLAWEESNRRIVVDALANALKTGAVEGIPGSISTHHVSVAALNKAITTALEMGVKTPDAQQLLLAAHTVRQLRNGILAERSEGGGSGQIDCIIVRDALRIAEDEGIENFPPVARREVELIKEELEDQDSAKILTAAIRDGGVSLDDDLGEELVFGVESLTQAIAKTQESKCHTTFTQALYKIAFLMRDLRTAMLEQSWEDAAKVIRIIEEIQSKVQQGDAPVSTQERQNQQWRAALILVRHEVGRARDEVENARIVLKLREAMINGRATGKPGFLRVDRIQVEQLDSALAYAVEVGCKTEEATVLYKSAKLLRQLRTAIVEKDFVTASVVIGEAQSLAVTLGEEVSAAQSACFQRIPVAGGEFEILSYEVENQLVCRALKGALKSGAVTGRVGAVAVTDSNIHGLEKAIRKSESLYHVNDETQSLLHSCHVILKLRQLLIEVPFRLQRDESTIAVAHTWSAAQEVIASAIANAPTSGIESSRVLYEEVRETSNGRRISNGNGMVAQLAVAVPPSNRVDMNGLARGNSTDEVWKEQPQKVFNLMWCHHDAREELSLLLDEIQHREAVQLLIGGLSGGYAKFMGGFVDVSTVKTGSLQAAIATSKCVRARTDEITSLQLSAIIILRCREALLDGSWHNLQQLLDESSEVSIHEAAVDELNLMRREMHLHSVIKTVLLNLQQACMDRNTDALEAALRESDSLRLSASPDLHVLARVNKARQLLDRLSILDDRLQQNIKRSDLHGLETTLEEATKLKYNPRAMNLACDLRDRLRSLFEQADRAIEGVDPVAIRSVLDRAKRENVALPRADEMRRVLSFPPSQLEKMRLNAAIERGDEETVCDVTMAIKSRFFENETTRERHRLEFFPSIKSPSEFASNTGVIATSLADGMLSHSSTPIPTSLTRLPSSPATSLAVKVFRALLGYCGDRQYSYPASLAQEILQVGLAVPEVRDEIFLQIIKQLTENPSQTSRERAWLLLNLALQTFPPSEEFENYLELWLRRKSVEMRGRKFFGASNPSALDAASSNWASRSLREMHRIVFRGPSAVVPSLDPVNALLNLAPSDHERLVS